MSVLRIHLTYQCTAACDHCRFGCTPASRPAVDYDLAAEAIRTLKDVHDLRLVVLMGGEPALVPELTRRLTELARGWDLIVRVETNASYATSPAAAREFLQPLYRCGARVCFALDAFHEPFIPLDRLVCAAKASDELGGRYSFEAAYLDRQNPHPLDVLTEELIQETAQRVGHPLKVYRGQVFFTGRAAEQLAPLVAGGRGVPTGPCRTVPWWIGGDLRTLELIVLDPWGNLTKGCGIAFGNMRRDRLEAVLASYDADAHPIFSTLLSAGPLGLAREARKMSYRLKADYADRCHLCQEVRDVLWAKYPEVLISP